MRIISRTRTTNLSGTLKFLHFSHIEPLLLYIQYCFSNNIYFDLSVRLLAIILQRYENKLFASPKMMNIMKKIRNAVKERMDKRINSIGYNVTALKFILKEMSYTKVEEFDLPQLKDMPF